MCQCWLLSFDKSITDKTNMRRFWRSISTSTPNNLCNFTANLELFTNKKFIKHLLPHKTKTTRKRSGRLLSYLSRNHKYPSQTLYIYTFLVNMTNIHNITECKISDKKQYQKEEEEIVKETKKAKWKGLGERKQSEAWGWKPWRRCCPCSGTKKQTVVNTGLSCAGPAGCQGHFWLTDLGHSAPNWQSAKEGWVRLDFSNGKKQSDWRDVHQIPSSHLRPPRKSYSDHTLLLACCHMTLLWSVTDRQAGIICTTSQRMI